MVSCSWRRAMAFSTDGWGAKPTPWSMSLLMVSRVRVAGWELACWTPSSHRACSSLTLSWGNSGRSTSKSKLTSNRLWISATLGASSARTFSLCCWKSSMRFRSSWTTMFEHKTNQNWCFPLLTSIYAGQALHRFVPVIGCGWFKLDIWASTGFCIYVNSELIVFHSLLSAWVPEGGCRRGYKAASQMSWAPPPSAGSVTSHYHTDTWVMKTSTPLMPFPDMWGPL